MDACCFHGGMEVGREGLIMLIHLCLLRVLVCFWEVGETLLCSFSFGPGMMVDKRVFHVSVIFFLSNSLLQSLLMKFSPEISYCV